MQSFSQWAGGATEEDLAEMQRLATKKFWIWLAISLIPIVNWVTMGNAIFCYNTLSYIKSRGRSNGIGLLRLILMIYAFIIPPIIVVQLLSKSQKLGEKILGWR